MTPSARAIALILASGIGGRSGDSFCLQNLGWASSAACSRRRPRPAATVAAKGPTTGLAAQGGAGSGDRSGSNDSSRYENVLGQTAADAEGSTADDDDDDDDDEAEALRRRVFSNEKGFLESSAFNPARARAAREEEEARALAARWGSTPERAKEVIKRTKQDKDLSFQELEGIAQELNMSDEQQRAFMLQASMKKLSAATALPRRAPASRVKEAVSERVFASEKGFLKNSAAFKSRLQVGSGVRFDSEGFPLADEDDPVIRAAKKKAKPAEVSGAEGVTFPSLPDCPRCSAPATEDELSQFGMCSQCKGVEVSSKAYSGPAVASKYTYDNGDAPFSASWKVPSSTANVTPAATAAKKDRSDKAARGPSSPPPSSAAPPPAAKRDRPYGAARGDGGGGGGGGPSPAAAAAAVVARTTGAAARAASAKAAAAGESSERSRSTGTTSRGAAVFQRKPAAPNPAAGGTAEAVAVTREAPFPAVAGTRRASPSNGAADEFTSSGSTGRRSSMQAPTTSRTASSSSSSGGAVRSEGSAARTVTPAAGRDEAPPGADGAAGDAAFQKLRVEVAELRTLMVLNRTALARVESMGHGRTTAPPAPAARDAATAGAAKSDDDENDRRRDTALRKLRMEVAELRREMSALGDKVSGGVETPPSRGARGVDGETMKREVAEMRSQLANARKETALTRSALRRLQGDMDDLRKAIASR